MIATIPVPIQHDITILEIQPMSVLSNNNMIIAVNEFVKKTAAVINNLSNNFLSVFSCFSAFISFESDKAGTIAKLANRKAVAMEEKDKLPEVISI